MASDRIILHLVKKKKIPDPLPLSRIMACTLLSLIYAPGREAVPTPLVKYCNDPDHV